MNKDQMEEYIELQRRLIVVLQKYGPHTMQSLAAWEELERFENNLECNQD